MRRALVQRLAFLLIPVLIHSAWFAVVAVCLGPDHEAHGIIADSCMDHFEGLEAQASGPELLCPPDCGAAGACVDVAFRVDSLAGNGASAQCQSLPVLVGQLSYGLPDRGVTVVLARGLRAKAGPLELHERLSRLLI